MQILFGILIYMLGSSILLIGYVWIRDIINRKSKAMEVVEEQQELFEETDRVAEDVPAYRDYRQKIA